MAIKINDFGWDLKRIKLEKGIDDKWIYEDRWITTLDASWVYPTFFSRVSQMEWQILLVVISITNVTSTKFVFFSFILLRTPQNITENTFLISIKDVFEFCNSLIFVVCVDSWYLTWRTQNGVYNFKWLIHHTLNYSLSPFFVDTCHIEKGNSISQVQ